MTLNHAKSGFNNLNEYLCPSIPFITSSQVPVTPSFLEVPFPNVTNSIKILNNAAPSTYLLIAFTRNGLTMGRHIRLNGGEQIDLSHRVTTIFLAGETSLCNVSVDAGCTSILASEMPLLSGTYWPGVG